MKKLIGFMLFWVAVGMSIMIWVKTSALSICVIIIMLIVAYNLFCSDER